METNTKTNHDMENTEALEDTMSKNVDCSMENAKEDMTDSEGTVPAKEEKETSLGNDHRKRRIAIGCGLFLFGVAVGVGGTIVVQQQPWNTWGILSGQNKDYNVDKCVALGEYKGISVSLAVSDEDVQSEIDDVISENTQYEQKSGTVKEGDMIYAQFDGYVDGKKIEDTCGEEVIDIGSGEYIEGFDTGFVGAKTGEAFSFDLDIPENTYGDDAVDGKKVTFQCTVKYICGKEIVPEWNDDFVQSISDFKTTEEYKADLKAQLEEENESGKQDFAWTAVLENAKVKKYPTSLMEAAKEETLQGYYDMAEMYGMSRDEIFQTWGREDEADFVKNDLEDLAKDSVKEKLVTEAIAKAEGIHYSDEEYQEMVLEEYEYSEEEYDSKEKFEKENREYLQGMALSQKVQEWVANHAKFTK